MTDVNSPPFEASAPPTRQVVALVLAAGQARRFGAPKLLASLQGRPLIRHTVRRVLEADLGEVIVVSGNRHEALAAALADLPIRLVRNPRPTAGLSSSLKAGIAAAGQAAVLVALGDQPTVPATVIRALVTAYHTSAAPIVCPVYDGVLGNPVVFAPDLFPELLQLEGDRGARQVIERDASRVNKIPFGFAMPEDVDTVSDLKTLRELWHGAGS